MKNRSSSRELILVYSDTCRHIASPVREPFSYMLFLILPALLYGCTALEETYLPEVPPESPPITAEIATMKIPSYTDIETLDIFTFNDDRQERLDSYQRFENTDYESRIHDIASCSGNKTVILLANSRTDRYEWADINCRKSLEAKVFDLESETHDNPVMSGCHIFDAGIPFSCELKPLSAEIILRSIKCDFSGESYAGDSLQDVRVYLTNVSASCRILPEENNAPIRIINSGMLNEDDVSRFSAPEIICQRIKSAVGANRIFPGIRLLAYPNCLSAEHVGAPYTRLVVEGRIRGKTYYYPIAVNRPGTDGFGIRRGQCYTYDLTIRKAGLTDPDGIIDDKYMEMNMEIMKWEEKDWYEIGF